jgi:hypothetical protein
MSRFSLTFPDKANEPVDPAVIRGNSELVMGVALVAA